MQEVFIPKEAAIKPSFNMGVLFNSKKTFDTDIGLEIEVEGKSLPREDKTPAPWLFHIDHSLRGAENGEYILAEPIKFDDTAGVLDKLWAAFKSNKTVLDESNRTSVHVHLNCQNFYLNRLTSFIALYFIFEEMLTAWCGEHREGNLFCLRAKDAPGIVSRIRRFLQSDGQMKIADNLHYSGLNIHALTKFGSIEIRSLRGVSEPKVIVDWVEMLRRLYDLSAQYDDPREICQQFSAEGPMAFFNQVMGPHVATLRSVVSYNDEQVREAMFEGMRLSQDLCYCKDWTEYKNVRLSADPFGRDAKKIAKRLYSGMTIPQNEETGVAPTPMPPGWTTDPFTIGPQWEGEPDHDED